MALRYPQRGQLTRHTEQCARAGYIRPRRLLSAPRAAHAGADGTRESAPQQQQPTRRAVVIGAAQLASYLPMRPQMQHPAQPPASLSPMGCSAGGLTGAAYLSTCACPCRAGAQTPPSLVSVPDVQSQPLKRWAWRDKVTATAMAYGMQDYEAQIAPVKTQLFAKLAQSQSSGVEEGGAGTSSEPVNVLELGIGTGPNLGYLTSAPWRRPLGVVAGIDQNAEMQPFARERALEAGLTSDQLRLVQGDAGSLPWPDDTFDAAVCTLVLCSVPEPSRAVSELRRVLKPGGQLLFIEHVGAKWDDAPFLRTQQELLNPLQRTLADGCTLTRDTRATLEQAGFSQLDCTSTTVDGIWSPISPHVWGLATK